MWRLSLGICYYFAKWLLYRASAANLGRAFRLRWFDAASESSFVSDAAQLLSVPLSDLPCVCHILFFLVSICLLAEHLVGVPRLFSATNNTQADVSYVPSCGNGQQLLVHLTDDLKSIEHKKLALWIQTCPSAASPDQLQYHCQNLQTTDSHLVDYACCIRCSDSNVQGWDIQSFSCKTFWFLWHRRSHVTLFGLATGAGSCTIVNLTYGFSWYASSLLS